MLTLGQRLNRPEITLEEAIYQYARDHRGSIPGVIGDVSTAPNVYGNTVDVDIAINEVTIDPDTGQGVYTKIVTLKQVKLATIGAGGFYITLPVAKGDECMLIFQDMCLDAAWQSGGINNPQLDKRRHDLSDAICLPLRWTQKNAISSVSNTSLQIRSLDNQTHLDLTNGAITLLAGVVALGNGTQQALVTADFYTWFTTNVLPFLVTKGYLGPNPPIDSITTKTTGS